MGEVHARSWIRQGRSAFVEVGRVGPLRRLYAAAPRRRWFRARLRDGSRAVTRARKSRTVAAREGGVDEIARRSVPVEPPEAGGDGNPAGAGDLHLLLPPSLPPQLPGAARAATGHRRGRRPRRRRGPARRGSATALVSSNSRRSFGAVWIFRGGRGRRYVAGVSSSHRSRRRSLSSAAPPRVSSNHGSSRSTSGGLVVVVTMY